MTRHGDFKIAPRLSLQKILHAAVHMFSSACDAKGVSGLARSGVAERLTPDHAARVWLMQQKMIESAQRRHCAILERDESRQPVQPRGDPGCMTLGESAGVA